MLKIDIFRKVRNGNIEEKNRVHNNRQNRTVLRGTRVFLALKPSKKKKNHAGLSRAEQTTSFFFLLSCRRRVCVRYVNPDKDGKYY